MTLIDNYVPQDQVDKETAAVHKIQLFEAKIEKFLDYAKSFSVTNGSSAEEAITLGGEAKSLSKKIETTRKGITEPARKFINRINDVARSLSDKLDQVEDIVKSKVSAWKKTDGERQALENKASAEMIASLDLDVVPYMQEAPKNIRGDGAMSFEQTVWKFEVTNEAEVPRQYLSVDEAKIKLMIKAGIREIPGLKIYTEQKTIIRTR